MNEKGVLDRDSSVVVFSIKHIQGNGCKKPIIYLLVGLHCNKTKDRKDHDTSDVHLQHICSF